LLLGAFYVMDRRHYARAPQPAPGESGRRLRCDGLWNLVFLSVIVAAVFIPRPWFLREGLMLAAAAGSFLTTGKKIHEANQFSFEPMFEVAVLFFGIFATLMPVLDWLYGNASIILGSEPSPSLVYWSSGGLSSVLDSAGLFGLFQRALGLVAGAIWHRPTTGRVEHRDGFFRGGDLRWQWSEPDDQSHRRAAGNPVAHFSRLCV
jgi:hypothetical protein